LYSRILLIYIYMEHHITPTHQASCSHQLVTHHSHHMYNTSLMFFLLFLGRWWWWWRFTALHTCLRWWGCIARALAGCWWWCWRTMLALWCRIDRENPTSFSKQAVIIRTLILWLHTHTKYIGSSRNERICDNRNGAAITICTLRSNSPVSTQLSWHTLKMHDNMKFNQIYVMVRSNQSSHFNETYPFQLASQRT